MMMCESISANNRTYYVAWDLQGGQQLLVIGRVHAAETGRPLMRFHVDIDRDEIYVKHSSDGFYGLAGKPDRLFPPGMSQPLILTVTITAKNGRSSQQVSIPPGADFPIILQPA